MADVKLPLALALLHALSGGAAIPVHKLLDGGGNSTTLVTFDNTPGTTFEWNVINDPVMGGLSASTMRIENTRSRAVFNGTVAIVPKLQAPGFCQTETKLFSGVRPAHFADVSAHSHLILVVRSSTPGFAGFKVSFAADTLNPLFHSFKANFRVPGGTAWQRVAIPWHEFSNDWSPYTGDCDTTDRTLPSTWSLPLASIVSDNTYVPSSHSNPQQNNCAWCGVQTSPRRVSRGREKITFAKSPRRHLCWFVATCTVLQPSYCHRCSCRCSR